MKETTKKNSLELPREVLKASGLANGQELGALSLDGVVLLTRDSTMETAASFRAIRRRTRRPPTVRSVRR